MPTLQRWNIELLMFLVLVKTAADKIMTLTLFSL
jgi:hypothetical protein